MLLELGTWNYFLVLQFWQDLAIFKILQVLQISQ